MLKEQNWNMCYPAAFVRNWLVIMVLGVGTLLAQAPVNTITFDAIPNQIFGSSPFPIAAKASSGLVLSIVSATPAVCRVAGSLIMLLEAGTCSITANQSGNGTYSAASPVTRNFAVSLAEPSGTLAAATDSPLLVGGGPASVAVGDFNGDGIPDIATANMQSNNVTVLLGNGSGGFTPAPGSPFGAGSNPYSVVVGDFNGDGIPDIAAANYQSNNVTVLLGNGAGGFTPAAGSPFTVGTEPYSIVVGDFNGDGIQDLATVNFGSNNVTLLLGTGSGGFSVSVGSSFAEGSGPRAGAVGDFNRDGIQDLAVVNPNSGTLAILLGNGSGGFTVSTGSPFAAGMNPTALAVGDFNGDGIQDLAVTSTQYGSLTVLLGNGSGAFTKTAASPYAVGTFPTSVVIGDFNGDGIEDIATSNNSATGATVLLGNGAGAFTASIGSPIAAGFADFSAAVGDFNRDGVLDLVTANSAGNAVTVLLGGLAPVSAVLSTSSPSSVAFGQSVPLSLAVSDTAAAFSAPTGTAIFSDGATILGTVSQTSGSWTFTAANLTIGSHTLTATYSGDTRTANSTSNNITIQVNQAPQTITFGPLGNMVLGSGTLTVAATASSGLPVSFASTTPATCTVSGTSVTLVAVGTCSITASQAGNTDYLAATPVTQNFSVTAANGAPAITSGGVVPIFSSSTTIQPGSWISIYGTNLASQPVSWNGDFPTLLGGVTVSIDGRPAYLWYVSPTQINAQAPDDSTTGNVNVTVTNPGGSSTTTVTLGPVSPSFSLFDAVHVAGIILRPNGSGAYGGGSYDILGPTGSTFGFPHPAVAAKQGDSVVLFGVGYGPTSPTVPAGKAFVGSAATTNPVQLTIGGASVIPSFAGMGSAGLYQLNLTIPAGLKAGDVPLAATVAGVQTQSGIVISLQ